MTHESRWSGVFRRLIADRGRTDQLEAGSESVWFSLPLTLPLTVSTCSMICRQIRHGRKTRVRCC